MTFTRTSAVENSSSPDSCRTRPGTRPQGAACYARATVLIFWMHWNNLRGCVIARLAASKERPAAGARARRPGPASELRPSGQRGWAHQSAPAPWLVRLCGAWEKSDNRALPDT